MAHDVLGEQEAAKGLLPRVDLDAVAQHRHVHHVGPGIDEGDDLVLPWPGNWAWTSSKADSAA